MIFQSILTCVTSFVIGFLLLFDGCAGVLINLLPRYTYGGFFVKDVESALGDDGDAIGRFLDLELLLLCMVLDDV